jgi:hypothetical protein
LGNQCIPRFKKGIDYGKLTRQQWYELDEQFSCTPAEPFSGEHPGEHMKLIVLLNRFGYQPVTKQQALNLARTLLDLGW